VHSSWKPWDFVKGSPYLIQESKPGIYVFYLSDIFLGRILQNRLERAAFTSGKLTKLVGADISADWLENTFLGLSLFGGDESYLVLGSETTSVQAIEYLSSTKLPMDDRFLIFFIFGAKYKKEVWKKIEANHIKVEAPKFWEMQKLLHFMSSELNVRLDYASQKLILENVEHQCSEFYSVLQNLSVLYPNHNELTSEQVKPFIALGKIDKFELASLYGRKRFANVYESLVQNEVSFEEYHQVFSFFRSHFIKLSDPSYMKKKGKLSKYDQEILLLSKNWSGDEIEKEIVKISDFEILSKQKSTQLKAKLRLAAISNY
jgi:hypothetical protein